MSNFTTLESTPVSPSPAAADQEVKTEPQIDALASSEAKPETTSPSAGKDASPSGIHRCRRCGESVKSVQFHQRTVHQKRCVVVFPDGTKETLVRPADGERFTCSKCSYGHRDPQYLQIHARQKCSGQPPDGGLKPETPRRKRRKTEQGSEEVDSLDELMNGDTQVAKEETSSTASAPVSATQAADGHSRPRIEMPSIETIDRARSATASPQLSGLRSEWAEDFHPDQRRPHPPSTTQQRSGVDVSMNGAAPEAPVPYIRATSSRSVSPSHEAPSTVPPSISMAGPSAHTSPAASAPTSRASSRSGLRVHTGDHLGPEHRVAQQPTPTSSIPPSPLLPQNSEDITGRFALVPAFPLQNASTSAPSALAGPSQSIPHPHPHPHPQPPPLPLHLLRRPDESCAYSAASSSSSSSGSSTRIDARPTAHPVDAFLRSLSNTLAPPPHVARAFRELGYDTEELLDALARANPAEGDWDLLEKEVLVDKRFHAWWILVKNGLRARRDALERDRGRERGEWAR